MIRTTRTRYKCCPRCASKSTRHGIWRCMRTGPTFVLEGQNDGDQDPLISGHTADWSVRGWGSNGTPASPNTRHGVGVGCASTRRMWRIGLLWEAREEMSECHRRQSRRQGSNTVNRPSLIYCGSQSHVDTPGPGERVDGVGG